MITRRQIPSMLLAFGLLGSGAIVQCTNGQIDPQKVIDLLKQNCGLIATSIGQITALINAGAGATAEAIANLICTAWQNQQANLNAAPGKTSQVVVVVNGKPYPVDVTKQ